MTFVQESLRDKPAGLFGLDDLVNAAGGSSAAFPGTSAARGISLTSGERYSHRVDNTHQMSFPTNVYREGRESQSFTLEASARLVRGTDSPIQILGHQNTLDGLTIDGTEISFSVEFDGSMATCSYDMQRDQAVHCVGVFYGDKLELFVNAQLVAQKDLTDVQKQDVFASADTALYSGHTATSQSLLINGVGIYNYALSADSIKRHFIASSNLPVATEVVASFSGASVNPGIDPGAIYFDRWFSTASDWNDYGTKTAVVLNDRLQPYVSEDTSVLSTWEAAIDIEGKSLTSIESVNIFWSGRGATVEVSLDAQTWTEVVNSQRIPLIGPGFNPTGKTLFVRITFPGGILNDESFIDNLNIVGVEKPSVETISGHSMSFGSASQKREYVAQALHDNNGVELATGATMTLLADTSESPLMVRTIEFWAKSTSATQPTINFSGTKYINGLANSGDLPLNEWCLVHIVFSSDVNDDIVFTGPVQIGNIGLFSDNFTAADIASIYEQYYALSALRVEDVSLIQVEDFATPATVYNRDWTNLSTN